MQNFQLCRTNVFLGGQMKYDIIINSDGNNLYISDFHISPLSDSLSYNKDTDDNLLINNHFYNIKKYYSKVSDKFYDTCVDPRLKHDWPLIPGTDNMHKQYYDDTMSGCKRTSYKLYGKQYEFLCPLWIEQLSDVLGFDIQIYTVDKDNRETLLSSKTLNLSTNNHEFHNKFVNYFNSYISECGLASGDNRVMNIKFDSKTASINGINIKNGCTETKLINNLVDNLLYRERPLIEFDSMIINSFKNNNLISKQLFNFNLIFDISDIASNFIYNSMMGESIVIKCFARIGEERLEIRDFYSKFSNIKTPVIYNNNYENLVYSQLWNIDINTLELKEPELIYSDDIGVLDYLSDDKCVDFINSNKISQDIVHWQLYDNDTYIFNVYDGFGCVNNEYNNQVKTAHTYKFQPDMNNINFVPSLNNVCWINILSIASSQFDRLINNYIGWLDKLSLYYGNDGWISNLRYYKASATIGACAVVGPDVYNRARVIDLKIYEDTNSNIVILLVSDKLVICSDSINNLTFANIKNICKNQQHEKLKILYECMSKAIEPSVIYFNKGVAKYTADSPSPNTDEITYYKINVNNYVIRYDGYIKPNIIPINNIENSFFYKLFANDESINRNLYDTGFTPKYPSVGYYSLKSFDVDYNNPPQLIRGKQFEYKWYNSSALYIIKSHLEFNIELSNNTMKDAETETKSKLSNEYKSINTDYLYTLYNTEFELINIIDNKYNYLVKLTLK